ncbi:hypothetical protein NDU88_002581 [Pleurodeles waltl]|uniref:Uncharacterized protein n=1 Tax=Pleurodeles waltl TaxID=8319 RepID=A0AAV7Q734_PLEWA|nr:hypothetical protein NDU88_002581 [Pleurodeles waltl]
MISLINVETKLVAKALANRLVKAIYAAELQICTAELQICAAELTYPKRHWGRVREILSPDTCCAVLQDLFGAIGMQLAKGALPPGFTWVPA